MLKKFRAGDSGPCGKLRAGKSRSLPCGRDNTHFQGLSRDDAANQLLQTSSLISESVMQPDPQLEGFDGMKDVGECSRVCWRYSGDISVVNVVVGAVEQIKKLGQNAPAFVDVITDLCVEQRG